MLPNRAKRLLVSAVLAVVLISVIELWRRGYEADRRAVRTFQGLSTLNALVAAWRAEGGQNGVNPKIEIGASLDESVLVSNVSQSEFERICDWIKQSYARFGLSKVRVVGFVQAAEYPGTQFVRSTIVEVSAAGVRNLFGANAVSGKTEP